MRTHELTEALKAQGYEVSEFFSSIRVHDKGEEIASVSTDTINSLYTRHTEISNELFDLLVRYAKTPLDERKYTKPYYIEHQFNKFYVGEKYRMGRYGEEVIAELAFGENRCDGQPSGYASYPGLRGPAAMLTTRESPASYGFYWKCEATENYAERELAFLDLIRSTEMEDFDSKTKYFEAIKSA